MKTKFTSGIIICLIGFLGLTFSLIDKSGTMGSKIPLSIFFMVVMVIGIVLEILPKEILDNTHGEYEGNNKFR